MRGVVLRGVGDIRRLVRLSALSGCGCNTYAFCMLQIGALYQVARETPKSKSRPLVGLDLL